MDNAIERAIALIDQEIAVLRTARAILTGDDGPAKLSPAAGGGAGKRTISPEGRARMAASQRARRAKEQG